ncbi:hypothetical protein VCR15J2_470502 [Vibrio coralliirubri]|nr:hypothetical protein VCR15J2_470502 [Vibrio coralliirubri]
MEHAKNGLAPPFFRIAFRMRNTALVGGTCVDIRKSMSRFIDAYAISARHLRFVFTQSDWLLDKSH